MATGEALRRPTVIGERATVSTDTSFRDLVSQGLTALASLRLTVILFGLSIFLIFVGTLAQKDHDIFDVMHSYFQVWFARVELRTFERLAQIFFKSFHLDLDGSTYFYFPGGNFIGTLLLLNLFAAHAVRFKIAASGKRLAAGLAVTALGLVATCLAIQSGMNDTVESELSPQFCAAIWQAVRFGLVALSLAGVYLLMLNKERLRPLEWRLLAALEIVLVGVTVWLLFDPTARPDDPGMRILWQLAKGVGAGLVLLLGLVLAFKKRAGIVLLHGGVALMMLSQMWTALSSTEMQTSIPEGGSVSYSYDTHRVELALLESANEKTDRVTVVPESLLSANVSAPQRITDGELPVDVQVFAWYPNSRLRRATPEDSNPATVGLGLEAIAEEAPRATGGPKDKNNFPAAYVELFEKNGGKSLGKYLITSQLGAPQPVTVNDRLYEVALRFKRYYWPFSIALQDFRHTTYAGTDTAKDFSSLVVLRDPERNVERNLNIWMNNPLRYSGMTFYQSSFDEETETTTVLQVVKNAGWMGPYVACMLVVIGMIAHFGGLLWRFIRRDVSALGSRAPKSLANTSTWNWAFPTAIVVSMAWYLGMHAKLPTSPPSEMQVYEFGHLPVLYQGRVKPFDTIARQSLQYLSGKQELLIGPRDNETKEPAIHWLLDALAGTETADDYRVFRIENLDLLDTLGLERRPGSWRYSFNEIRAKSEPLSKQIELAAAETKAERPLSLYQRKVVELYNKIRHYGVLISAFQSPSTFFNPEDLIQHSAEIRSKLMEDLENAPLAVFPVAPSAAWQPLAAAEMEWVEAMKSKQPPNPATMTMRSLLTSYAKKDTATFNLQLAELRRLTASYEQAQPKETKSDPNAAKTSKANVSVKRLNFEVLFNEFSPFYYCAALYLMALFLGVMSWIGWTVPLRRASIWLIWFTFAVHTIALLVRMNISGRPPITNLYSAAVFIGWAGTLLAIGLEYLFRLGLGNIVAAVLGFCTLLVAYFLSLDGDTMIVLQAVLDTQFWLATHVVCIATGYATTYVAGLCGIAYILLAHVFPVLTDNDRRELSRMTYGALCFAILFSFFGTVLGGLWADDSWGRFWGWDPKENGALIIVLYNALVLHARWGGVVKQRGIALLTVGGNIAVTWSFFGVNELGVGLHSYGASESSTAMWLLIFAASQLAFIALGALPRKWFAPLASSQMSSST